MGLLKKNRAQCRECRTQLENAIAAPAAKGLSELLAAAPDSLKLHVDACADCREAAEDILAARALLSAVPSNSGLGGQWFAPRVMAAIAARKAELSRVVDTWTFLPRLAAHLTWASSVALLLASAWLYQRPASTPAPTRPVLTDITGEPIVDTVAPPASDDEVLLSLAEKH